jgi:hypothetical protein
VFVLSCLSIYSTYLATSVIGSINVIISCGVLLSCLDSESNCGLCEV